MPARLVTFLRWRWRIQPRSIWDWSKAGQEGREDDHFTYLKIKGEFIYEKNFKPTYLWFNGNNEYRYLLGDKIDPNGITYINKPAGNINDPKAKIFPFKLHVAKQPYDVVNKYLLQPITSGKDGFWTTFNWNNALKDSRANHRAEIQRQV